MEAVGVDDPSGNVTVLDEALCCFLGCDSLLHTRAFAGWAAPSKRAVVLDVKVKLNVLCDHVSADTRGTKEMEDTFVCTMANEGSP